jgi:flagellar operon protein (TIGR03826 family)
MNLTYCPRCNNLFAKTVRDVCNKCAQEIEEEYERVSTYLRKNRGATINEVSEATEVSVQQITKFIREGRITTNYTPNLTIPCDMCGKPIQQGNMCASCRKKLQKEMEKLRQPQTPPSPRVSEFPIQHTGGLQIREHRKP